jgi:hypothetical protein
LPYVCTNLIKKLRIRIDRTVLSQTCHINFSTLDTYFQVNNYAFRDDENSTGCATVLHNNNNNNNNNNDYILRIMKNNERGKCNYFSWIVQYLKRTLLTVLFKMNTIIIILNVHSILKKKGGIRHASFAVCAGGTNPSKNRIRKKTFTWRVCGASTRGKVKERQSAS